MTLSTIRASTYERARGTTIKFIKILMRVTLQTIEYILRTSRSAFVFLIGTCHAYTHIHVFLLSQESRGSSRWTYNEKFHLEPYLLRTS